MPPLETDANTATIRALESTVTAVSESNAQLRERLREEWDLPKIAFKAVIALFGLNLFGSFAAQIYSASSIQSLNEALNREIQLSKEERKKNEDLASTVTELEGSYKQSLTQTVALHQASDSVLSRVTMGRHHLIFQQNATQARVYAKDAERILSAAQDQLGDTTELSKSLDDLWLPILILIGDAGIGADDIGSVNYAAAKLLERDCQCVEGSYFRGIGMLDACFDVVDDPTDSLETSIEALRRAVPSEDKGSHPAYVLLAAAYLQAGKPAAAIKAAEGFLLAHPSAQNGRLNELTRTRVAVVGHLLDMARVLDHRKEEPRADCGAPSSFLPSLEARILEQVIESTIQSRVKKSDLTPEQRQKLGKDALVLLNLIRNARCGTGESEAELRERLGLPQEEGDVPDEGVPAPAPAPAADEDDAPMPPAN